MYNIDVALVDQRAKEEWDALVKSRVQEAAAAYMSRQLEDRELPPAERRMQCRRYVQIGGCNARYGVRFRWDMLCRRATHAERPHLSSSSWLFYLGNKPSADATHARGGIGQLHPRWGREYAAQH